jgi:predicted nucleic acid-binding protein
MRIYVESSVFGQYPPAAAYQQGVAALLFSRIQAGRYQLVVSEVVRAEMRRAPVAVWQFYTALEASAEVLPYTAAGRRLARTYHQASVLPRSKVRDALHVALATLANCAALLSWDADIARPSKVAKYQQANLQLGQPAITILTPDLFLQTYP